MNFLMKLFISWGFSKKSFYFVICTCLIAVITFGWIYVKNLEHKLETSKLSMEKQEQLLEQRDKEIQERDTNLAELAKTMTDNKKSEEVLQTALESAHQAIKEHNKTIAELDGRNDSLQIIESNLSGSKKVSPEVANYLQQLSDTFDHV
ncbi:hypothetical protein [Proteus mirabilis]|uniref:hypothetical protein n=1 Tax=Proteus mirabilis TaxID=584 RepID=UPI0034D652BC